MQLINRKGKRKSGNFILKRDFIVEMLLFCFDCNLFVISSCSDFRKASSDSFEATNMQWDNCESEVADDWDDENMHGDVEHSEEGEMVPQPRKVLFSIMHTSIL